MSVPINDGGPAYPVPSLAVSSGMTLRQYAAIKLCVPNSGLPWLDEMIVQSNRQRLAAAALQGNLIEPTASNDEVAKYAYSLADAMPKAREAK